MMITINRRRRGAMPKGESMTTGDQRGRADAASNPVGDGTEWEPTGSLLLTGISALVTVDEQVGSDELGTISDGAVVIDEGQIVWVGPAAGAPDTDDAIDLGGRTVLPGWVDSHTHLVFAGDRSAEFAARMAGQDYRASGILATVEANRETSTDALTDGVRRHLAEFARGGTTTVETKSGYGLTKVDELRSVQAAERAGIDALTFLGAHVVPPEYADNPDDYVDLVCGPMLEAVAPLVQFVDVFCEEGAFDDAQARRVLSAAERLGLDRKVHGNQLRPGPGVQLAVSMGATSVDHCTYLTEADIDALSASTTVATLLPATDLCTRRGPAPARELIDAGATVALASNCNPGSGYTSSMALVVALAVIQCRMTVAEAIRAATLGGAQALNRSDIGRIAVGMRADLQVLDAPGPDYLAYRPGVPLTAAVWRRGVRVV
ncbi:imidazolonepropionase [Nakamurella aerolata]|uniref:Imidazolonepropionase n=1 Tax=Nakamurella aerolata TaxID=1656892 RepID=A0A849A7V2_9ACTN|nr:imidazolonepropionase [Nakamurella aerolata]NNG36629.1 imidazolonepropionase [Nakamurella aerolata]